VTPEKQESHRRELCQKFHDAGLKINSKKTVLGRLELTFCGYLIREVGTKLPPDTLEAIKHYLESTTVKYLKSILGAINFFLETHYAQFCCHCCASQYTFARKKITFAFLTFSKAPSDALTNLILALCNHATLAHQPSDAETVLLSDPSWFGTGDCHNAKYWQYLASTRVLYQNFSSSGQEFKLFQKVAGILQSSVFDIIRRQS